MTRLARPRRRVSLAGLIPKPVSQRSLPGQDFTLTPWSIVGVDSSAKESRAAPEITWR